MSDEIKKLETKTLAQALVEFQFLCESIDKDAEVEVRTKAGGSYTFRYASYGNIVQTIRIPMYRCGLSYSFPTSINAFVCRITHNSGAYQETIIEMPKLKDQMQENGSNITYLMRYTLKLALGLDVDSDDDANGPAGNDANFKVPPKEHIKDVNDFIQKKGKDLGNYVVRFGTFKNKKLSELDHMDIQKYLVWLHGQAKELKKPLTGDALEFAKIAEAYISGETGGST